MAVIVDEAWESMDIYEEQKDVVINGTLHVIS